MEPTPTMSVAVRSTFSRCVQSAAIVAAVASPLATAPVAHAGDLASDVAELLRKSGLAEQRISYAIHDVRTGKVIAAHNAEAPMAPASNMKVLTTGAALAALGADFTFDTTLFLDRPSVGGTPGPVRLTLVGSGDPALDDPDLLNRNTDRGTLGVERLAAAWAEELRKAGVTKIDELVVDARVFDREFYHPSWPKEQYPNAYCAEVWGLNVGRNTVGITPVPKPDGKPTVEFTPNFALTVERNAATCRPKDKFTFSASRAFGSNALTLRGNAAKRTDTPLALTVHDTPSLTAELLSRALAANGVTVATARIAADDEPRARGTIVPPIHSTPIATVLERANTDSENLYAEALLKRLGAAAANLPVASATPASGAAKTPTAATEPANRPRWLPAPGAMPGSWTNGRAALRQSVAQRLGAAALTGWTIDDGCGLSQENRVTASGLAAWIAGFARDPSLAPTYFGSFAIAGKTGTVRKRFDDLESAPVEVRCKTGYIRGVSTLSGLVIAPNGGLVAFSILGNNLAQGDQIARARALQESLVRRIVQEVAPEFKPRSSKPPRA